MKRPLASFIVFFHNGYIVMEKNIVVFIKKQIRTRIHQVKTLFVFLPYFFSVSTLLRTMFYPWKLIVTKKETRGFSFSEWANRTSLNIMSSGIGAIMRFSMISFFVIFELALIISLPILCAVYLSLILPIEIILYITQPTPEEMFQQRKSQFIATHCLKPEENKELVEKWFLALQSSETKSLFSYPPLARDWAYGYTPTLDEYVEDLTSPSYQSITRHVVGRGKELDQLQHILGKLQEANAIVVGEEGVGKHTVIDALARMIYDGSCVKELAYKRVLKLNMEKILNKCTDFQQREAFFEELLLEAQTAKSIVLVIENIEKYTSQGENHIDLSSIIERFAKQSEIQFIGMSSPFSYQRFLFPNEKIQRLFTKVDITEISKDEAKETILHAIPQFELRFNTTIPFETAVAVVTKSEFYITYIPFPEKALALLDEVCAGLPNSTILPEHIDVVLAKKTHIPTTLTEELKSKLLKLEIMLSQRVLFQENAIHSLAAAVRRSFILLGKRKKPLATFLFLGPTGVGKTETAKAVADIFFGSQKYLVRFDMSLYQSKNDIKTLIGSIESGLPGLLPKTLREQPYAVLLLDELEKAHPDLINIFLTVIDEGYFTDGYGKRVDCKNLIIIATSNAGSDYVFKQQDIMNRLSSVSPPEENSPPTKSNSIMNYLVQNHIFSPEFLNRFDGVIEYSPINEKSALAIAQKTIQAIQQSIYSLYRIRLTVADASLVEMIKTGYDPAFGARNLERSLTQQIEDKIASLLLEDKVKEGQTIQL